MRLEFHPLVASDISQITRYYERVAGSQLADDFYTELQTAFLKAARAPEASSLREKNLRRVNLERFPYHFLFRIANERVRVLVVRHHGREPSIGKRRR